MTRDAIAQGLKEHYSVEENRLELRRKMNESEWHENVSKGKLKYFEKEENLARHSLIMSVCHSTDQARENSRKGQESVWTEDKRQEHSVIMKEIMGTDEMRAAFEYRWVTFS